MDGEYLPPSLRRRRVHGREIETQPRAGRGGREMDSLAGYHVVDDD